ncbi:MAG: DoxX family protein [Bacteroidota bacterium]
MKGNKQQSKALNISLWVVQAIMALMFIGTGIFKLITPVSEIAKMWPWAGENSNLLRFTGLIDLLGGIGIIVPTITKIKPALSAYAALGCAMLMICAIVFHFSRGEGANTPFNFALLSLALFVFWGRRKDGATE